MVNGYLARQGLTKQPHHPVLNQIYVGPGVLMLLKYGFGF